MIIQAQKPYNGTYKTVSRWIKVRETLTTEKSYFIHNNRRYKLDDFLRLHYPIMWEDKDGKLQYLSAYDATTWYNPYLLEVDDCGEYVRLWEEVKED